MALSQTNLCNKRPFPLKSFPTSMRNGKASFSDSIHSAVYTRQVKEQDEGVSERSSSSLLVIILIILLFMFTTHSC